MLSSRLGNNMDNRLKFPLTHSLLLLCYAAGAVVAGSTTPEYRRSPAPASATYNPQPHDFPNEQLYHAYVVIQRFKSSITCDPREITSSWIGHDICGKTTYVGFECATLPGHGNNLTVTSVSFDGFGLCAPSLEGFIDQLPDLALFQASANNFGGDIPSLSSLDYFLKVEIVDEYPVQPDVAIGTPQRPNFIYICVKDALCRLENTVQKEVVPADYTNAKALLLNNNFQSGSLPANLGFSKLSYLALANNNFSGTIPPSIQYLGSLLEILLLNNQLSGCLPHELGMLTNAAVIDVGMNQLTGPIPSSFSCLSSVEQLNLAGNRLYGEVPDALCKLAAGPTARLANLSLSGNYFTSIGPACAAMIEDGVLDVSKNCIPGLDNQRRPVECAAFLSQPKTTCRPSSTQMTCPAAASQNTAAQGKRKARDYSSYVMYATLHG